MVNPNACEAKMIYTHINGRNLLYVETLRKINLHNLDEILLI